MATIHSNGSKWHGQEPDTLDELIGVLAQHTLDPSFEDYGNFVSDHDKQPGVTHLFGNFYGVSHVFRIDGTQAELQPIIDAIRANQATPAYQAARREWLQDKAERARRDREMMAGLRQRKARATA